MVFHVASYGMSGREQVALHMYLVTLLLLLGFCGVFFWQLNKKLIEEVNIGGTRNVLDGMWV